VSQVTLARNRSLHFLDNHSVLLASPLQQTRPQQNNVGGAKGYGATRLSPPKRKKLPRDGREWSLWPEFGWIPGICATFQRDNLRRHF
jgi:hypothetical protein